MIYATGMAKTVPGFHIVSGPVISLKRDSDPAVVGGAVLETLDAYQEKVPAPNPRNRSKELSPFLKATGFRSWKAVEDAAVLLLVEEMNDGRVCIIPNVRDRLGGYAEKPDLAITVSSERSAIGHAVLEQAKTRS